MAELTPLVAVSALPGAGPATPLGAAVAVAAARRNGGSGVVLCEVGGSPRRPTLLAAPAARELEARARGELRAAARGAVCWVAIGDGEWAAEIEHARALGAGVVVAVTGLERWRALAAGTAGGAVVGAAGAQRSLAALVAIELLGRGLPVGVLTKPLGAVAARRALAGIEPGGEAGRRVARLVARMVRSQEGQALPALVAFMLAAVVAALALALAGAGATAGSRLQRAADLAAVSAARSLRDDHHRAFLPERSDRYLAPREVRGRARRAASRAVRANGLRDASVAARFAPGPAPTRVRVSVGGTATVGSARGPVVATRAVAEAYPAAGAGVEGGAPSPGEHSGPLATRQGERMRPDVAVAFDALSAAARRAGHILVVNSAYRSDAEQAALFAANPDPRWVARPGTSLHRCGTELDLGPPAAYGWLAANAGRFGFVQRYSWEPWHYGFARGPKPCSAAADTLGDGAGASRSLPAFVPAAFRAPIARAAGRWDVPAAVLAAQLMAESGFDPDAVSPAGARGIAQFMPATAAAYGLRDPFDARSAIAAQARLMSDLMRRFGGSLSLALAAYNAGPAPVAACGCVPAFPETRAYVARILGLLGGAGAIAPPALEVRLVR